MFAKHRLKPDEHLMISIALIRHPEHLEQQWLSLRNEQSQELELVTAVRPADQSWRECLDQQIAAALLLRKNRDYLLSKMPRLHYEDVIHTGEQQNKVEVAFFVVDLYGPDARAAVENDPRIRWVHNLDLRRGHTDDGSQFSAPLSILLQRSDVIRSF